jgi:hypothetical protein
VSCSQELDFFNLQLLPWTWRQPLDSSENGMRCWNQLCCSRKPNLGNLSFSGSHRSISGRSQAIKMDLSRLVKLRDASSTRRRLIVKSNLGKSPIPDSQALQERIRPQIRDRTGRLHPLVSLSTNDGIRATESDFTSNRLQKPCSQT